MLMHAGNDAAIKQQHGSEHARNPHKLGGKGIFASEIISKDQKIAHYHFQGNLH